jgi:hypothetical protein
MNPTGIPQDRLEWARVHLKSLHGQSIRAVAAAAFVTKLSTIRFTHVQTIVLLYFQSLANFAHGI